MSEYVAPELDLEAFNCPYCGAYAHMHWYDVDAISNYRPILNFKLRSARCAHCQSFAIWTKTEMIIPSHSTAPMPNKDMPESVKNDYLEARDILNKSPRGACALLRLALDKLCDELSDECKGKDLNIKIKTLVTKGLKTDLQRMFDFVRLTGNDAVHELGKINAKDNPQIATALFGLINMIIDEMITKPQKFNELFNLVPKDKVDAIEKRDAKALGKTN